MLGTFIQTYGFWILLGVAFVFMMRMHGGMGMHGGGCGTSHDAHTTHTGTPRETVKPGEEPPAPDAARPAGDATESNRDTYAHNHAH